MILIDLCTVYLVCSAIHFFVITITSLCPPPRSQQDLRGHVPFRSGRLLLSSTKFLCLCPGELGQHNTIPQGHSGGLLQPEPLYPQS